MSRRHQTKQDVGTTGWLYSELFRNVSKWVCPRVCFCCALSSPVMPPEVMPLLLLVILLTWFVTANALNDPCDRNESIDLHIIGFFPCTASSDTRSIAVDNCDGIDRIPIMKLALEEINERCDLLPGYRLVVDYADSGVSRKLYTEHVNFSAITVCLCMIYLNQL